MDLLEVLTQFFDTIMDKLLLLFLIRDRLCFQMACLTKKINSMKHFIMLIINISPKITGVVFKILEFPM